MHSKHSDFYVYERHHGNAHVLIVTMYDLRKKRMFLVIIKLPNYILVNF